ncbi:MAG TPA: sodium:solute symporter [Thermoanaerobaculia bacterium]|nr:sodium:solute symporter [Thermoanaerobaculia bacterium]
MTNLDWAILVGTLVAIVVYGVWKGRKARDLEGYLLAGRGNRWYTVALSIMATQASAITFLSTPGQAYSDGMRFIQFYLGLPLAMVVLSITAVPLYRRLRVYTAYEYLEGRFDLKTRSLAALLFLIQRGLACGLTIYAPAIILSTLMGWDLRRTILVIGVAVVIYTASGGTRAVNHTNFHQMLIILVGMVAAFIVLVVKLPDQVGMGDAAWVAGKMGKLNAIDLSFDLQNRYNLWSGLLGGFFLALSYFGTDQSQVQRYLSGQSVAQSRLALLFNGMVKVPMQFFILFIGAMVFAFYQFTAPPLFFNTEEVRKIEQSRYADEYRRLEAEHRKVSTEKQQAVRELVEARRGGEQGLERAERRLELIDGRAASLREEAVSLFVANDPGAARTDTNYVFLTFVVSYLPAGLIGLVMAAIFSAAMSSTASELNALASTTIVDVYKRMIHREGSELHMVLISKLTTVFWGAFAIGFAMYANRLGSLIEAVNILGSLFYGTILGIFLLAFYVRRVGGTAAFAGALIGEAAVIWCFRSTEISFLWYNVVGCLVTMGAALIIETAIGRRGSAESQA